MRSVLFLGVLVAGCASTGVEQPDTPIERPAQTEHAEEKSTHYGMLSDPGEWYTSVYIDPGEVQFAIVDNQKPQLDVTELLGRTGTNAETHRNSTAAPSTKSNTSFSQQTQQDAAKTQELQAQLNAQPKTPSNTDTFCVESSCNTVGHVLFDHDSSLLTPSAQKKLDSISHLANKKIEIVGYADNTGHPEYNEQLALSRAQSVYKYLRKNGFNNIAIATAIHSSFEGPTFRRAILVGIED